jgi:hypothetical protein
VAGAEAAIRYHLQFGGYGRLATTITTTDNPCMLAHHYLNFTSQEPMASYFIFGAVGQCPTCGDHRFSGPMTIEPQTSVTCHKCKQGCSIEKAVLTALAAGTVKKLSDHRVVGHP